MNAFLNCSCHLLFLVFLILLFSFPACAGSDGDPPPEQLFDDLRNKMVERQIQGRGVGNPKVLDAMRKVKRHLFVAPEHRQQAYEDYPLPIGEGQTISQPYIVGLMSETLASGKTGRVLEIGTGSGYQAAVLAEFYAEVFTIEIVESLGTRAEKLLQELGYKNIHVKIGDGYKGWLEHGPFDAVIVTCAPTHIPQPLKDQLAEGGRMVIPVGETYDQQLVLLKKEKGEIVTKEIIPVRFVPMVDKAGKPY